MQNDDKQYKVDGTIVTAKMLKEEAKTLDAMFMSDGVKTVDRAIMILENQGHIVERIQNGRYI